MHPTIVKNLLQTHFGPVRTSLTLGGAEPLDNGTNRPAQTLYFYNLNNRQEIAEVRDLLDACFSRSGRRLPELYQPFAGKKQKAAALPQCACWNLRDDGHWRLSVFGIQGVTYHRTYGGKPVATLRLCKMPAVTLSDLNPAFYGYWEKSWFRRRHMPETEREGFSYWINKALQTNGPFRAFSVDFFCAVADAEQRPILKDVAQTIQRCRCFLPPISCENLLACRTPADVIRFFSTEGALLPFPFDNIDLNTGYVMQMLAPAVAPQDRQKLANLDAKTVADAVTLPLFYGPFQAEPFLSVIGFPPPAL